MICEHFLMCYIEQFKSYFLYSHEVAVYSGNKVIPLGHNKQLDAIAQVQVKVQHCTKIDERPNSVSIGLYLPMYIK